MINKVGFYITQQFKTFMNNQYEHYDKMLYYSYNEIALLSFGTLNNNNLSKKSINFIKNMREKGSTIIHCQDYSEIIYKNNKVLNSNLRNNIKNISNYTLIDKGLNIEKTPINICNSENSNIFIDINIDYDKDVLTNSSTEILNFLYEKKIKLIVAFGNHDDMFLLNNAYNLKCYLRYGFPIIISIDLCNNLYNNISIKDYYEQHICPTINSNEIIDLNKKTLYIDIDNTITIGDNYNDCICIIDIVSKLNKLFEDNKYNIIYWTSRGCISNKDYYDFTKNQLAEWNVKYNILITKKPFFDKFIDEKSINLDNTNLNIIDEL